MTRINKEVLYSTCAKHDRENEQFVELVKQYEWADFYRPNAEKSPWHWVCAVRGEGPYVANINIWTTTAKGQREGMLSVKGWDAIRGLIAEAIEENGFGADHGVIE